MISSLNLGVLLALATGSCVKSQVPGAVYTTSGYDNVDGKDSICWWAPAFHNHTALDDAGEVHNHTEEGLDVHTFSGINWNSSLVPDFVAGPTTMLPSCPSGTWVHVDIVPETVAGSSRLRTGHLYTYHVSGQVNLTQIREQYDLSNSSFFYSSDGSHTIGLRIEFCPVNGNLCSPFAPKKVSTTGLDGHVHHDGDIHDEAIQAVEEDHHYDEDEYEDEDHNEEHGDEVHNEEHEDLDEGEDQSFYLASPLFRIPVDVNETVFEFHQDVDVEVSVAGNVLPLASLQFFLSNETIHGHAVGIDSDAALKFDVANLLHQRSLFYYEQPNIMSVNLAVQIVSYVIIGAAAVFQFFLLGATCFYRDHSVMKLSQGSFLIVLQVAGIVATTCSCLYLPKSDVFCYLQSPMTLIPLQLMLAIVFGRLRRIICIMEPLMDWHSPQKKREMKSGFKAWKKTFMMGRSSTSSSSSKGSSNNSTGDDANEQTTREEKEASRSKRMFRTTFSRSNIRQTYTARRLWLVVALVSTPIIIVEIVGLVLFRPERILEMNAEQSTGRYECGTTNDQIYNISSTGVLFVTLFATLYQALRSRMLPGLFNEAACVSIALISSLFVASLGFAVIIVSDDPSTSPDASYLMEVLIVTFVASSLAIRVTLPKLQLIWKGEQVVISRMLAEHRKESQQLRQGNDTSASHRVSGLSSIDRSSVGSLQTTENRTSQQDSKVVESMENGISEHGSEMVGSMENGTSQQDSKVVESPPIQSGSVGKCRREGSVTFDETTTKRAFEVSETKAQPKGPPLIIRTGEAPPDKLTFHVLRHSNVMSRVNERILSGLQVDHRGWEDVQASVEELHGLLGIVEYQ